MAGVNGEDHHGYILDINVIRANLSSLQTMPKRGLRFPHKVRIGATGSEILNPFFSVYIVSSFCLQPIGKYGKRVQIPAIPF
jgi:hypothetical protein